MSPLRQPSFLKVLLRLFVKQKEDLLGHTSASHFPASTSLKQNRDNVFLGWLKYVYNVH